MEILLVKQTLPNGLASPASIQLERKLRASQYWSHLQNKRVSESGTAVDGENSPGPALVIKDGAKTTVFTDVPSFEQFSQAYSPTPTQPQAACW